MIFIDTVSIMGCFLVWRLVRETGFSQDQNRVQVLSLDPISSSYKARLLVQGMRLCKLQIEEVDFFAGSLKTQQGESVWIAAKDLSAKIAFKEAEVCLTESKTLKGLNKEWGRKSIQLFIAEQIFHAIDYSGTRTVFKVLVADALSRDAGSTQAHLILGIPAIVTQESIVKVRNSLDLHTYQLQKWSAIINRVLIVFAISAVGFKRLIKRIFVRSQPKATFGDPKTPALLLLQEDDLSMDRSYRSQPHWIFKDSPPPAFRSLVLETGTTKHQSGNHEELGGHNIFSVPKRALTNNIVNHPTQRKVDSSLRAIIRCAFFGDRFSAIHTAKLVRLLLEARLLAGFCVEQNVKAFMTCENYFREASAMNLIGPTLGITTISYQYSNIPRVSPTLMTSAEKMCTFSPLFHNRWRNNNLGPVKFHDIGYLYDGAFKLLRKRSNKHKEQLTKEGVEFIVAYFDESVQSNNDKYGVINETDHLHEIRPLAELVLNDHKCAVITKSQFVRCIPSVLHPDETMLKEAVSVGRFVELHHGSLRNNIFPAEAALTADIVIGHAIGATAGLEAALVGTRCILLNSYNQKGPNIDIFEKADVLYEDIHAAIEAVNGYRQGRPEFAKLGLWDDIINQFDPYRDGQSAVRLRECLEHIFQNHGGKSQRNAVE
jgi:hypothetical protein